MPDPKTIHKAILERLSRMIDPETGINVIRMRLVEDLVVDDEGQVSYTFHPSSPLCPIAVPLSHMIQLAVAEVPGVTAQNVKVIGFTLADELTEWLKQALESRPSKQE